MNRQVREDQVPWTCPGCGIRMLLTMRIDEQEIHFCNGCGAYHATVPVVGACSKCEHLIEQQLVISR